MKKYEFTGETKSWLGRTLRQIRALRDFADVEVGDTGGWIENESNLDHDGDAWVSDNAQVSGNARVSGNAWVYGNAWVSDDAQVSGNAHYLLIGPIGSRSSATTFFRTKDLKICVTCGCFRGDIDTFAAAVQKTHGDSKYAQVYLKAIEMAKLQIDLTPEEVEECTPEDAPAADAI